MTVLYPLSSFALCLLFTIGVRAVAHRRNWLAFPKKDRWHSKPTALFGGIAIYLSIVLPLFTLCDLNGFLKDLFAADHPIPTPPLIPIACVGITFSFLLGLVDDFKHIKPQTKLIGQILIASLIAFLGFRLNWFESLTVDTVVTIIWIVGITNALNLIDNMDGLCAGTGLVAVLGMAFLFYPDNMKLVYMALILAGAFAGFLVFNFNPASIFMGDCGSLPIGFALALLAIHFTDTPQPNSISIYAVPILMLMVPIFDTSMVSLIRILSGRRASTGGRDHTSHRLVLMGFSERSSVLFLYGIGLISVLSAIFVSRSDTFTSPLVIAGMGISLLLMGIYLAQIRVYDEKEFTLLKDRPYTPVLLDLTYRRQLTLVILDFCLIAFVYYLSYRLRFSGGEFSYYFKIFLKSLPAVIICKFIAFFAMGVYKGFWRYISTQDIFSYIKASVLASLLTIVLITYIFRFEHFSKGIFLIDWFLTTGILLITRGSFRFFRETMSRKAMAGRKVFIWGAGRGGELLMRELLNNSSCQLHPIGFLDDDPYKKGKTIQGSPILGSSDDLPQFLSKSPVEGVLVSFRGQDPSRMNRVKAICRKNGLFLKQFTIDFQNIDLE